MNVLIILNDAPYGSERSYNGLRLAGSLAKKEANAVKVFLIGDAAICAKQGQKVPQGYYNVEIMLKSIAKRRGEIGVCGTCMDARGMAVTELVEGTKKSTLDELTSWVEWADKVMTF